MSEALTELKRLIEEGEDPADPKTRVALSQLALEVNRRLQEGSPLSLEFMAGVVSTMKTLKAPANTEIKANCLLDAAHYYYVIGQSFSAIEPSVEAVRLAATNGHKALLRKAQTFLGIIYADTGNISRAIECHAHALDLAIELRDVDAESVVWVNLGIALLYAAQHEDAISCFERAIRLLTENPKSSRQFLANVYSNIALCCLHSEDFSRGLKAAEACVREAGEPHTASELVARVLRETYYARLLLEVNNLEKAGERCELARRYAAKSNSARAEIAASVAEGLYEVQSGRVDVGISRLTATLERARLLKSSTLRDTLAALVKAYEMAGQPDRALIYLREMIEALRNSQQENALRHIKLHLTQVGEPVVGDTPIRKRLELHEAALQGKVAEQELFKSRIEMLERLAVTAELRDDSTGEHSYRVGRLASLLAQEFGCDEDTCYMIDLAARLHDIGKIGVPDAILLKPDKLNEAERQIMRSHSTVGAELLSKSNIPHMQMAEEIARHHHEWWNGAGYPGNLSGSAIPLAARITAIADVFDALTHKRPYKRAWPVQAALDEIARLKGSQFDPQLTDHFIVLISRLQRDYRDLDEFLGQAAHNSPFLQARSRIWQVLHKGQDTGLGSRLDLQR